MEKDSRQVERRHALLSRLKLKLRLRQRQRMGCRNVKEGVLHRLLLRLLYRLLHRLLSRVAARAAVAATRAAARAAVAVARAAARDAACTAVHTPESGSPIPMQLVVIGVSTGGEVAGTPHMVNGKAKRAVMMSAILRRKLTSQTGDAQALWGIPWRGLQPWLHHHSHCLPPSPATGSCSWLISPS